jgi:SNF2 family DNA or RNA helicase
MRVASGISDPSRSINVTIEDQIVDLHHQKRDLANSLLEGADMSSKVSTDDLLRLIQEG